MLSLNVLNIKMIVIGAAMEAEGIKQTPGKDLVLKGI